MKRFSIVKAVDVLYVCSIIDLLMVSTKRPVVDDVNLFC